MVKEKMNEIFSDLKNLRKQLDSNNYGNSEIR